ncbi:IPExxxVDY family protein [Edaphocola flava]|uniref:IPExxxVDY family protein n=1 Tax=Edaphocola flava TaxID=2499629 RepID=UPI0013873A29|nr:IPExxxVDY family protein [Edaphocola flava]
MELLTLDLDKIEDDFFDNCQLLGLQTNASPTRLCWLLETYLGLCFQRRMTDDIDVRRIYDVPQAPQLNGTLFDHIDTPDEPVHFLVYRHVFHYTDLGILLYTNHRNGYYLLPESKSQNYLLLIQDEDFRIRDKELAEWLQELPTIEGVSVLPLDQLKHKSNLII